MQDDPPAALRAALEWLVRLNDDRATPALQQAFAAWLEAAPDHGLAWREANALWSAMTPVKAEYQTMQRRDRMLNRRQMLGGLAVAALAGGGYWQVSRPWFRADHATAAGQTADITLSDGTLVNLGSRSAIGLAFGPGQRGVRLLRGEAFFSVAAGALPFAVTAMERDILTSGGRFNVNLGAQRVAVAVAEQGVRLPGTGAAATELGAGWSLVYDRQRIHPMRQVDPLTIGAWRQGRMIFRNTPLAEVLAEIERWRGGSISVWSAEAAEIPVTAIFDTKSPDLALATIVQTLGLRMVERPGGVTLIRAGTRTG